MSFPLVLLQPGVRNEDQQTELTTVKLTPNAHSQFQTRFVIPKQGSVLDSNSALVWRISWDGYDASADQGQNECVVLKQLSGGLNTLLRARFYIGGREIFSSEDAGHLIHIKRISADPDYQEEMIDKEIGSQHGVVCTSDGQFKPGPDGVVGDQAGGYAVDSFRYARKLGSFSSVAGQDKSIECSVLLSDIFSALQSLSLPMALEQMRLEIDWETGFDEVATVLCQRSAGGGRVQITDARKVISIQEPRLLLDYLTFNEDLRAGLATTLMEGTVIPYVHTSVATKVLPENTGGARTDDVLLALQGKLLMKMYVSQRFSNVINGNTQAYQLLQGRCRSQTGVNQSYNLFVNDLAIHDLPVDSDSLQYSFLEMTHQGTPAVMPGVYGQPELYGVAPTADNTVVAGAFQVSGFNFPTTGLANTDAITATQIKDGQAGTQSYIGFDLSKYDEGSKVVPANAGYRVGSSAVILRITQDGGGANTPARDPKTIQVFTEEVRMLQLRGGMVDTMEA